MITQAELKELVVYNPETGIFTLAKHRHGTTRKIGEALGSLTQAGYLECGIKQKVYLLHRLAFLYMTGEMPKNFVDHKNRNKEDNSWGNLRQVTYAQNMQNNIAPRKHGSLGVRGVYKYKDRYRAKININKKQIHLGEFQTMFDAAIAYAKAKKSHHLFYHE